jgi:hypothetical protein
VEIKVGMQQVNREIVVETHESAADVEKAFAAALESDGMLALTDERGRKVLVRAKAIGYLDIGEENTRTVGFGG